MLNRLLSWIKTRCFNKHSKDDKISLESLGIKFVLFQKQPKVVAFNSTEYSETRWIAELINSEIQQSKQGAQEMIDRLNSAKKDPSYQWEGTTNSLIIKITNQEVSLLPLYDQFEDQRKITPESLIAVLTEWIEYIHQVKHDISY